MNPVEESCGVLWASMDFIGLLHIMSLCRQLLSCVHCFHHLSAHPSGEFVKGDLAIAVQVHFRHHCLDRLHRNHGVLDLSIVISESSIYLIYLIYICWLFYLIKALAHSSPRFASGSVRHSLSGSLTY